LGEDYDRAILDDCDFYHDTLFAIEGFKRNRKRVWKIRARGPEDWSCVGIQNKWIGESLIHMDCDDEDSVLWIIGDVGDYSQIRPAEADHLCLKGDILSTDCRGDRSLFKHRRNNWVYDTTFRNKKI